VASVLDAVDLVMKAGIEDPAKLKYFHNVLNKKGSWVAYVPQEDRRAKNAKASKEQNDGTTKEDEPVIQTDKNTEKKDSEKKNPVSRLRGPTRSSA
jgi:hypothetical protein